HLEFFGKILSPFGCSGHTTKGVEVDVDIPLETSLLGFFCELFEELIWAGSAHQIAERKPVFHSDAGRCTHPETLSVFQQPTDSGRTWNPDTYRDGDILTRQSIQPVCYRIDVKAELGDDALRHTLIIQAGKLVLSFA